MCADMSLQSVQFAVTFIAIPEGTLIRSIHQVYVRMASQMSFTYESFMALGALKRFVVSL